MCHLPPCVSETRGQWSQIVACIICQYILLCTTSCLLKTRTSTWESSVFTHAAPSYRCHGRHGLYAQFLFWFRTRCVLMCLAAGSEVCVGVTLPDITSLHHTVSSRIVLHIRLVIIHAMRIVRVRGDQSCANKA